ncbi:MAG: DUF4923 family protein [Rikenellaceae bacterium]
MRKTITTLSAALMICGSAGAFSLSDISSSAASSAVSTVTSAISSSTVSDVVSTVASALLGDAAITTSSITGTWTYDSPAVILQSDNSITEAAGTLATSTIESKLGSTFSTLGMSAGTFSFTFNSDNSFSCTVKSRTLSGTYAIDGDETLTLTFSAFGAINLGSISTIAYISGSNLSLLFEADKLLDIVSALTSVSESSTTLSTVNSLLSNYNGVRVGFEMTK